MYVTIFIGTNNTKQTWMKSLPHDQLRYLAKLESVVVKAIPIFLEMDHNRLGVQLANTPLMNTQLLEERNVRKVDVVVRNFTVRSLAVVENQFLTIRLEKVSVAFSWYMRDILSRVIQLLPFTEISRFAVL